MNGPFSSTAYGAAHMGNSGCASTAGKDETAPSREAFLGIVDGVLEGSDIVVGNIAARTNTALRGICCQHRTDGKQQVLYLCENINRTARIGAGICGFFSRCRGQISDEEANERVEFVDSAIGFQTDVSLGDALTAYETGHAGVASAGVEMGGHMKVKNEKVRSNN